MNLEVADLRSVRFDPAAILEALSVSTAAFVVIGGVAATLHGSPMATADVDAVALRTGENRERFAAALVRLDAALLVSVDVDAHTAVVLRQPIDASWLGSLSPVRLLTRFGVLDLLWSDPTVGGFDEWDRDAVDVEVGTVTLRVASVARLIESKQRADRDKDRAALPFLRALRRRQDSHGQQEP